MEPFLERTISVKLGQLIKIMLANASEPLDNDTALSDAVAHSDDNPFKTANGTCQSITCDICASLHVSYVHFRIQIIVF